MKEWLNSKGTKISGYTAVLSIIVLAVLVAVNILVSILPVKLTQLDISATQLYSLSSSSKAVVTNLDKDVTIYWICQKGKEYTVVEKLLKVYEGLSDHIKVVKKDPDEFPTFAEQYTSETVSNNSLVVECGDVSRYIAFSEIYEQDATSYSTTGSVSASFDGEGEITTAIDYVTSEDHPQVYVLTGHNESALSNTFTNSLQKENMQTTEFSLLNVDEIPEDADCILINSPATDISEEEATMLLDYIADGGNVLVLSGPQEETALTNLNSVVAACGATVNEGIILEGDRDRYAFSYPYILMPEIQATDITQSLIDDNSNVIEGIAAGLTIGSSTGYEVSSLLNTSSEAFSKVSGYAMPTSEKEEGDIDGPFSVALLAVHSASQGKLVWFSSDVLLDDTYNSYSSGANVDIVLNSISYMIGKTDSISIRAKSLDYNYLTISASQATLIKIILIGAIPVFYLLYGAEEVIRRRRSREA